MNKNKRCILIADDEPKMVRALRDFFREQLLDHVWGYDFEGGYRTMDTHIRQFRGKLGACADYISNVWQEKSVCHMENNLHPSSVRAMIKSKMQVRICISCDRWKSEVFV